jgi:hypothetical protein
LAAAAVEPPVPVVAASFIDPEAVRAALRAAFVNTKEARS